MSYQNRLLSQVMPFLARPDDGASPYAVDPAFLAILNGGSDGSDNADQGHEASPEDHKRASYGDLGITPTPPKGDNRFDDATSRALEGVQPLPNYDPNHPGKMETLPYDPSKPGKMENLPLIIDMGASGKSDPYYGTPEENSDYYPNGVRKQAMDERLPSGETMYEATAAAMKGSADDPSLNTSRGQMNDAAWNRTQGPQIDMSASPGTTQGQIANPNPPAGTNPDGTPMQEQAMAALAAPSGGTPQAMKVKDGKIIEDPNPPSTFTYDPNKSPEDNRVDELNFIRQHPQNQDHGVKGFIKELLSNFFEGLSHAQYGMNVPQSLLLGATGAGAGIINRGWNEQRAAERELPYAQQAAAQAMQRRNVNSEIGARQMKSVLDAADTQSQIAKRTADAITAGKKVDADQLQQLRQHLTTIWTQLGGKQGYTPGQDPALDRAFKAAFPETGGLPAIKTPEKPVADDTFQKMHDAWEKDTTETQRKVDALVTAGQRDITTAKDLTAQAVALRKLDPGDPKAAELDAKAAELNGKGAKQWDQGEALRKSLKPEPKNPNAPVAPRTTPQSANEVQATLAKIEEMGPQLAQKNGWTPEQAAAQMAKAKEAALKGVSTDILKKLQQPKKK